MAWVFLLRKPPCMLSCHDSGIASKGELSPLSHSSTTGFNHDPIALFDAFLCSCIKLDLNNRILMKLSKSSYLSVFCMKKSRLPRTCNKDVRIFLVEFRR